MAWCLDIIRPLFCRNKTDVHPRQTQHNGLLSGRTGFVQGLKHDQSNFWLIAAITLSPIVMANLVSSELARTKLGLDIQAINIGDLELQESASRISFTVEGWTRVNWALDTAPDTIFNSTFLVTQASESPFDILFGQREIRENPLLMQIAGCAS